MDDNIHYQVEKEKLSSVIKELIKFISKELVVKAPMHLSDSLQKSFEDEFKDNLVFNEDKVIYEIQEKDFMQWVQVLQSEIIDSALLSGVNSGLIDMGVNNSGEIVFSLTDEGKKELEDLQDRRNKKNSGEDNVSH